MRNEIDIVGSEATDEQFPPFDGARLEHAVNEVFRLTRGFEDVQIEVRRKSGGVRLSGMVKSRAQKERAEALARSVVSVQNVVNDLQVGGCYRFPETSAVTYRSALDS